MAEDYIATVRIRRPAKVTTDDRGRSVWAETVETVQLELVSTGELKAILHSGDHEGRSSIERLLKSNEDGVLARNSATGLYEVISDADLQAILESDDKLPQTRRPADVAPAPAKESGDTGESLSLVSTQMLRKIIQPGDSGDTGKGSKAASGGTASANKIPGKKDKFGGFDPYNNS